MFNKLQEAIGLHEDRVLEENALEDIIHSMSEDEDLEAIMESDLGDDDDDVTEEDLDDDELEEGEDEDDDDEDDDEDVSADDILNDESANLFFSEDVTLPDPGEGDEEGLVGDSHDVDEGDAVSEEDDELIMDALYGNDDAEEGIE